MRIERREDGHAPPVGALIVVIHTARGQYAIEPVCWRLGLDPLGMVDAHLRDQCARGHGVDDELLDARNVIEAQTFAERITS